MPESPRRADLRLTIPAASPYRELAAELAGRFAEYVGLAEARKADVVAQVVTAVNEAAAASPDGTEVEITLESVGGDVVVSANSGAAARRPVR